MVMISPKDSSFSLQITPAALAHLEKMLKKANNTLGFRLAVKNTGCSGKSYDWSLLTSPPPEDDHRVILEGLSPAVLCVDIASAIFLNGTVMDYVHEGLSGKFIFHNPQSKAVCGCGESFYV